MKRVLKYTIPVDEYQTHQVTGRFIGKGFLHVDCQHGADEVQVWAEVCEDFPEWEVTRHLQVYGTGMDVPLNAEWAGTVLAAEGRLVWHVYDVTETGS